MQPETVAGLSFYSMFMQSDIFMKVLVIGLIFASIWSWAIIFEKVKFFRKTTEQMRRFEEKFWSGESFENLYKDSAKELTNPLAVLFVSATKEFKRAQNAKGKNVLSIQERLEKVIQIVLEKTTGKMETKMTFLASVGSVAPLLGLFGTVWGIMDSFNAIGMTQSTNIAAVAPGVAAALFTTAVGLVAAIPALIAHNKLMADIDKLTRKMETFADELVAVFLRQEEE